MYFRILLLSIFISTITSISLSAQKLGLGIKLGADISQTTGFSLNEGFQGHFMGGLQAHLRVGRIGLQVEANLTQVQLSTGENFRAAFHDFIKDNAPAFIGTDIVITELGLPVMLELKLLGPLRIEAGVQYSMVINAKDRNAYLINAEQVIAESYMSGLLGAKLELGKVQVGARYLQGFSNLNKTPVREDWKSGRYQLYASYFLYK